MDQQAPRPSSSPGADEHAPVDPATSPDTEPDTDAPPTEPSPDVDDPDVDDPDVDETGGGAGPRTADETDRGGRQ